MFTVAVAIRFLLPLLIRIFSATHAIYKILLMSVHGHLFSSGMYYPHLVIAVNHEDDRIGILQ